MYKQYEKPNTLKEALMSLLKLALRMEELLQKQEEEVAYLIMLIHY